MGELLALEGRQSVRTPMQWSNAENGGFSVASKLVRSLVEEGPFSYREVNVAAQRHTVDSLLSTVQRLIRARRECPELGWGEWRLFEHGEREVLAIVYTWQGSIVYVLHNFADEARELPVEVEADATSLVDVLTGASFAADEPGKCRVALEPYGYRWLRVADQDDIHQRVRDGEI